MTPPADRPSARMRRQWWRRVVGLRGLMGLVLLVGLGLGWWIRHKTLRDEALATIRAAGGKIGFADGPSPSGSLWSRLYWATGVEELREVWFIDLDATSNLPADPSRTRPSPDEMVEAAIRLGPVEHLTLANFSITEALLARMARVRAVNLRLRGVKALPGDAVGALARLRGVETLAIALDGVDFPPGTFDAVGELAQLWRLSLQQRAKHLDPADLAPLARLKRLQALHLPWAILDGDGLTNLDALRDLEVLDMDGLSVDDATLHRVVARHPRLYHLDLDGSRLTDRGVEALNRLPNLLHLALTGGQGRAGLLSDASLATVARLTSLRRLHITCGRFTPDGLDALRALAPQRLTLGAIGRGSEAAIGRLVAGRAFERLALSGPGVTDAALSHLVGVIAPGGRTRLDLSRSAVSDSGAPLLARIRVDELVLDEIALTDGGLAAFGVRPAAPRLVARGTRITPEGAAAFEARWPGRGCFAGPIDDE